MSIEPGQLKTIGNLSNNATGKPSVEKMMEEQKEILLKIYQNSEKTRRYILFGRILSLIYLLLFIAPIIFAIIYLPPFLEKTLTPYQELLNINSGNGSIDVDSIGDIIKQFR